MKRFLFLTTCVSLTLASCVNGEKLDEVIEVKNQSISFSAPVVGANSRTVYGEMTIPYSTSETFNVFAVQHTGDYTDWDAIKTANGGLFMDNEVVHYTPPTGSETRGTWEPEDNYYWPLGKKVTFGAYSPSQLATDVGPGKVSYSSSGLNIKNFTVPELGQQYDLMFSDLARSKESTSGSSESVYAGVDINFNHALSSVKFKACVKGGFDAWIKKIEIIGVHNQGEFFQGLNGASQNTNEHTFGNPYWIRTDQKVNYVVYDAGTGEGLKLTESSVDIGEKMLLMPQSFKSGVLGANTTAFVRIIYKVGSNMANTAERFMYDLSDDWVMSRRYTYNIIIGGLGTIHKITFAPAVDEWTNTGGDINI